ncbi:hypothetical protein TSAR_014674, partial [Trichomalopsis sarcophagae]
KLEKDEKDEKEGYTEQIKKESKGEGPIVEISLATSPKKSEDEIEKCFDDTNFEPCSEHLLISNNGDDNIDKINTIVGRYKVDDVITIKTLELDASQFSTLRERIWINGLVIDALASTCYHEWTNVTYIHPDDTAHIIGKHSTKRMNKTRKICTAQFIMKDILFMPYVFDDHWRLLIVNLKEEEICLQGPYGDDIDRNRAMEAFTNFIMYSDSTFNTLRNINWQVWEINDRPFQHENDGHSCGTFVMHYLECLGSNKPFDTNFEPYKYRK